MTTRLQALRFPGPLAKFAFLALIAVFSFALPSILARAGSVSSGADDEQVMPDAMNPGPLLLQSENGRLVEAPRLATDVVMAVNGTIARVAFAQRFENPSDRWAPKPDAHPLALLKVDANERMASVALVLALLSALTFIVWRYHRRDYASPRRNGRRI